MIHLSQVLTVIQRKDPHGHPVPFSFKAVTLKGEPIEGDNCIVTSSHNAPRTVNLKWQVSGEIRKIRMVSFIEINGQEVIL